jgi:phenylpropionate dioxygenase-like ring-hydroxylating dioxygenase large terminal subunit
MTSSRDFWQAAARVKDLKRGPARVEFGGEPVVLFKGASGISALADRCPHRLMELSKGKVVGGEIECPYHGWRFDGSGHCTAIPGHLGDVPGYRIPGLKTFVKDGVVFLSRGNPAGEPYLHPMEGKKPVGCGLSGGIVFPASPSWNIGAKTASRWQPPFICGRWPTDVLKASAA